MTRNYRSTLLELFIPAVFLLLFNIGNIMHPRPLGTGGTNLTLTYTPEVIPSPLIFMRNRMYPPFGPFGIKTIPFNWTALPKLLYAPKNNPNAQAVMNTFGAAYGVAPQVIGYDTEAEIVSLFKEQSGTILGAVIFTLPTTSPVEVWNYTLRLNGTFSAPTTLHTQLVQERSLAGGDATAYARYTQSGFTALQTALNGAITNVTLQQSNSFIKLPTPPDTRCLDIDGLDAQGFARGFAWEYCLLEVLPTRLKSRRFPTTADDVLSVPFIRSLFPGLFLNIAVSYFVSMLVNNVVREKQHKLKEGLLMMGLTQSVYWLHWLLTYALMALPSALLLTAVFRVSHVTSALSSFPLVALFLYLYLLSMLCFGFALSAVLNDTLHVSPLCFLLSFLLSMGYLPLGIFATPAWLKLALSLLPHIASIAFVGAVEGLEGAHMGLTLSHLYEGELPVAYLMSIVAGSAVFWMVVAWYLSNVSPGRFGTALPFYFPLMPSYWRGSDGSNDSDPTAKGTSLPSFAASPATTNSASGSLNAASAASAGLPPLADGEVNHEPLSSAAAEAVVMTVRALTKTFSRGGCCFGRGRTQVRAVRGLSLDLVRGEIYCLLGHNGAGKTTTLSMLAGELPMGGGRVAVGGRDLATAAAAVRRDMGVCPQHDVLFDSLTSREHLQLYAELKGIPPSHVDAAVAKALSLLSLTRDADRPVGAFSGGMKRKLSVSVALLGDPAVVFLDEPTAGMDPYSRRQIWTLLQQKKAGRVMILTTHFMDEADLLGDRIGIMKAGQLYCSGTSLFLKNRFGIGYHLTLTTHTDTHRQQQQQAAAVAAAAAAADGSDSGFVTIESDSEASGGVSVTAAAAAAAGVCDGIAEAVYRHVPDAQHLNSNGKEQAYTLPLAAVPRFAGLLGELEERGAELGVAEYGLGLTTLEEVFLRTAEDEEGQVSGPLQQQQQPFPPAESKTAATANSGSSSANGSGSGSSGLHGGAFPADPVRHAVWHRVMAQLFMARLLAVWRLPVAVIFGVAFPMLYVVVAFSINNAVAAGAYSVSPPLALLPSTLLAASSAAAGGGGSGADLPTYVPYVNELASNDSVTKYINGGYLSDREGGGASAAPMPNLTALPTAAALQAQLFARASAVSSTAPHSYVSWEVHPSSKPLLGFLLANVTLGYNSSALPALPIALTLYANSLLRNLTTAFQTPPPAAAAAAAAGAPDIGTSPAAIAPAEEANVATATTATATTATATTATAAASKPVVRVVTSSHPLPTLSAFNVTVFLMPMFLGMAFITSSINAALTKVHDREAKVKHQLRLMGVGPALYWASNAAFDLSFILMHATFSTAMIYAFRVSELTGVATAGWLALVVTYALAVIPFAYVLSFAFATRQAAMQMYPVLLNTASIVPYIIVFVLEMSDSSKHAGHILSDICTISPTFSFYRASGRLLKLASAVPAPLTLADVFSWEHGILLTVVMNLANTLLYSAILITIERRSGIAGGSAGGSSSAGSSSSDSSQERRRLLLEEQRQRREQAELSGAAAATDSDVASEAVEVNALMLAGRCPRGSIIASHLRKEFPGAAPTGEFDGAEAGEAKDGDCEAAMPATAAAAAGATAGVKVAVHDLCLAIPRGEFLCLLGPNGAGKTTSLSMLTADAAPTSGRATLGGFDTATQLQHVFRIMGFCPQFDALFERLTVREHLLMYCTIKGMSAAEGAATADATIARMLLTPHAHKRSMELSGGNKRKLSVAIALLGGPDVLFLDEPSTGIDPRARRFMWDVITADAPRRASLLTTHSMEEAEALASRIGIMTSGRLRALGTPLHLKHKYGRGFQLCVSADAHRVPRIRDAFAAEFVGAAVVEVVGGQLKMQLPPSDGLTLGTVFGVVERLRDDLGIKFYSVAQTSLEQIFIQFARGGRVIANQAVDGGVPP